MKRTENPKTLSKAQLIEFCSTQLEVSTIYSDALPKLKESTELAELITQFSGWGRLYDTPMLELTGKLFTLANMNVDEVIELTHKTTPKQTPIKSQFEKLSTNLNPPEDTAWLLPLIMMALNGHVRCLEKFSQSMDQLLAKGHAGDDKALFCAVRIDPAVIHAYSFQARLCHAVLQNDKKFLQNLSKALMGKSPDLPSNKLDELRYLIGILEESDYLTMLNHDQWSEIFVDEFSIYPKTGKDPHASCKKQIQLILKSLRK